MPIPNYIGAIVICSALASLSKASAQDITDDELTRLLNGFIENSAEKPLEPQRLEHSIAQPPRFVPIPPEIDRAADETITIRFVLNGQTTSRVISRTANRVHVQVIDRPGEWLFIRNPIDGRRLSGRYIDHARRLIVEHDEASLRDQGIAVGWLDVALLGLPSAEFEAMTPTGESRMAFGTRFERYVGNGDAVVMEVWWSVDRALPLQIEARSETQVWTQTLEDVAGGVDDALLGEPAIRYPAYRSVDFVDYGEELHERPHAH